jgi:uncharacterized protein YxeA
MKIDWISIISLVFTIVTGVCALFIAYKALVHGARPNVKVEMLSPSRYPCGQKVCFVFVFQNIGYWYAKTTAINVIAFFNFPPEFQLHEVRFGAAQEQSSTKVRLGAGGVQYLKAKGLKLTYGDEGEEVHLDVTTAATQATYVVRVDSYSENGVSRSYRFNIRCSGEEWAVSTGINSSQID